MPTPVVWSERDEPEVRGWHDCTYSAVLMALIYAGKVNFPLGIYTVSEREALERSDSREDETGSTFTYTDEAIWNRYGLTMLGKTVSTAIQTRDLLETTGIAIALAGSFKLLPSDHPLRRWQWGFNGGHAVCVIPLGNGKVLWLDPLAPWKFAGDIASVNDVMRFAWTGNAVRYIKKDTLVGIPDTGLPLPEDNRVNIIKDKIRFPSPRPFSVKTGVAINGYDGKGDAVKTRTWDAPSGANASALIEFSGDNPPGGYNGINMVEVFDGFYAGLYVPVSRITGLDTSPPSQDDGITQADVDAARAKALADAVAAVEALS